LNRRLTISLILCVLSVLGLSAASAATAQSPGAIDQYQPSPPGGTNQPGPGSVNGGVPPTSGEPSGSPSGVPGAATNGADGAGEPASSGGSGNRGSGSKGAGKGADDARGGAAGEPGASAGADNDVATLPLSDYPVTGAVLVGLLALLLALAIRAGLAGYRRFGATPDS
jgi:hypothetical protein